MNIEDIKVKKEYYIHILIDSKFQGSDEQPRFLAYSIDNEGNIYDEFLIDVEDLQTLEPAPQAGENLYKRVSPLTHDPCRLFKKGDKVEYRPKDGRANPNLLVGRRYKVSADEPCDSGIVQVEFDGLRHLDTFVAYNNLQLVTPVEEPEPYSMETCQYGYTVNKGELILATYNDETHPNAYEAANAERDRLNAEYRKGMGK